MPMPRLVAAVLASLVISAVSYAQLSNTDRTGANPIVQLAIEIDALEVELRSGPLGLCARVASCTAAEMVALASAASRITETSAVLNSYLPLPDTRFETLVTQLQQLEIALAEAITAGPSAMDAATAASLENAAHEVLRTEQPLPAHLLPVTPPLEVAQASSEAALPGSVTAGAFAAACDATDPDLLAETPEVHFSPELDALLASLQNDPLLVYKFIRDAIEFAPYYGSRRSSEYVLEARRGNDFDKASLLIAAFRRLGIPSCYVRGTVRIPASQVSSWLGVQNFTAISNAVLSTGFIPFTLLTGSIYEIEHVWVEAYLDASNYRGIASESGGGAAWVPLAPAFHEQQPQTGLNLAAEMAFDPNAFLQNAIAGTTQSSPGDLYLDALRASVAANHPGEQLDALLWQPRPASDTLEVLPLSLPFTVRERLEESAEVPEYFRHKVTITAGSLSHTFDLASIGSKRLTIAYVPATPADAAIVASYGNIFDTPANLIDVRGELNLDGTIIASGMPLPFGSVVSTTFAVSANGYPTNSLFTRSSSGQIAAASRHAILVLPDFFVNGDSVQSHRVAFEQGVDAIGTPQFDSDDTLGEALFITGIEYQRESAQLIKTVARSMLIHSLSGTSILAVSPTLGLLTSGGEIIAVEPRGIQIDGHIFGHQALIMPGSSSSIGFLTVASLIQSSLEHLVLEEIWGIESVSTVKVLQLANSAAIPIFLIDQTNRSILVPQLTHEAFVIASIEAWLDAGYRVRVPRDPITFNDWTGTGWRAEHPLGPVASIISGLINGGSLTEIVASVQTLIRLGVISFLEAVEFVNSLWDRIRSPVGDPVSSPFGNRINPVTGEPAFHEGADFLSPVGTEVQSVADGIIISQYNSPTFGLTVIINHGSDFFGNTHYTLHAHNSSFTMSFMDSVEQGEIIALSGNTGVSSGPHVHFEIRVVPPGGPGPAPNAFGEPTSAGFFDQSLAVDPTQYVWPEVLTQP